MINMKKNIFNILISILITIIVVSFLVIVNTMVSVKYETDNAGDCISLITGNDLCSIINSSKIIIFIIAITLVVLLSYKKRIVKQ